MKNTPLAILLAIAAFAQPAPPTVTLYSQNFDGLRPGKTTNPATPGQDQWFAELAVGEAFGEIQNAVANPGKALHEFTAISNPGEQQTIDRRILPRSIDVSNLATLTLTVDFFARNSDYSKFDNYRAALTMNGGPHPGFEILGFVLYSGSGTPKSTALFNVGLARFDVAESNNVPVDLVVGRRLSWESWHKLTLKADLVNNTYLSLTVDGVTQDLSGALLPQSFVEGEGWKRGGLIETILAQIIPDDFYPTEQTASDIYWDNLAITATLRPIR